MEKYNKTVTIRARVTEDVKARWVQVCEFEGVNESEMLRRVIMQIPIIGKIPSSGTEMFDRLDAMHAKLVHADGDIEIVGHDTGRE